MSCKEIEILLQLAADGEVTASERAEIESHLGGCLACRRKEAWLDLLDEAYGPALTPEMDDPAGFADGVVAGLLGYEPVKAAQQPEAMIGREAARSKKAKKRGILARVVSAVWSRRKKRQSKQRKRDISPRTGWVGASVTSLQGFRAAGKGLSSAVSGPVQAVRWVRDVAPKRRRS